MERQRQKDCFKHAGQSKDSNRTELDEIMTKLPNNQSGKGRHKCVYCAYKLGYKAGITDAQRKLTELQSYQNCRSA